jgi:hypothetical protein
MENDWRAILLLAPEDWICRCANEFGRLGLKPEPALLLEWSFCLWRLNSHKCPEEVARMEFLNWPEQH